MSYCTELGFYTTSSLRCVVLAIATTDKKGISINLSDVLGAAALLVAIIAIPITYYLAQRARQVPDLQYRIDFNVLLAPDDHLFELGLVMELTNRPITCISRTRVAFWNERGDTVRGKDIVDSDPLRIKVAEGDSVLQSRTICVSRKVTGLTTDIAQGEQSSVLLSFDFLDAGDGGIFEVIHQSTVEPDLVGTIRGTVIHKAGEADLMTAALEAVSKSYLRRSAAYRFQRRIIPPSILQHSSWPDTELALPEDRDGRRSSSKALNGDAQETKADSS
jgi:hypothetical protein